VSATPAPISTNPFRRLATDLRAERSGTAGLPPGDLDFSVRRTQAFARNALPILLDAHRRHGPVFALRIFHAAGIFMLGPEANHYMTVSHAENFRWRDGSMGDLIPLLGDGLLTIDGAYHRRARRIMLPAFHRERLVAAIDVMTQETERAVQELRQGEVVDIYRWTRELALRIAMRALFGFDPDRRRDFDVAEVFERALGYFGRDYFLQVLRGPLTPWRDMRKARRLLDRLIYDEIAHRRTEASSNGSAREDLLSLLMEARDEDGSGLSDREVRDQVMTLMFAGHDTTTSTVAFLFHELSQHPRVVARLLAEQDAVLGGDPPDAAQLMGGLPELEMAMDETLRLYPPAWVGPRRAVEEFEFGGHRIPAGVPVHYCSWASHHLPEVFADPEAFVPERFAPDAKAALPKGAYIPFGGGSRTCIGMRFGQLEIKAIASAILLRCRLELVPGHRMTTRQMPTLSPRGGLRMVVRERDLPAPLTAAA
jgi:cytochrome P450